ncbi:MAG: 50S ribosomal protein L23 [Dehalococcoidia bacterium]|nr:50S ribosomal protein L23 [Dehalococcoidia bacterium]MCL0095080.1 50S ribosomal protein L23 [Dehalococcoidia bacterium]MCL0103055.1 50S ribosomal protein L23 [Dehalococcoidia bacterium]
MHIYEVLRRPVITEKNTDLMAQNKYVFEVMKRANKAQIKAAVEKAFKVRVVSVNTVMVPSKPRGYGRLKGQSPSWKKAIVTLRPGDKIEIFEGV